MKIAALLTLLVVFVRSEKEEEKKYDLTDKDQFSFYFKEKWQTMFNTPAPVANAAKRDIVALLADPLYFAACFSMAREHGNAYFENRLWGMQHAIKRCEVSSSTVLPVDVSDKKNQLKMSFVQNMTYVAYTNRFNQMSMHIEAEKTAVGEPYRIHRILDHCVLN